MGEELEMRWTVMKDRMDNVGLFVNRCIAERLDGVPPLPPSLTLISDGQVLFIHIRFSIGILSCPCYFSYHCSY